MKDALLAVEDARFYEHSGIDPISVARARRIGRQLWSALRRVQGGSTITSRWHAPSCSRAKGPS